jgi:hypothetical protein
MTEARAAIATRLFSGVGSACADPTRIPAVIGTTAWGTRYFRLRIETYGE